MDKKEFFSREIGRKYEFDEELFESLKTISNHCKKQESCENCDLSSSGYCLMNTRDFNPPCDWSVVEENRHIDLWGNR